MANNLNESRALRVWELISDYNTLQVNIQTHVTGPAASHPNAQSQALLGYVLLRQCAADAQRLLNFNQGQLAQGLRAGRVPSNDATRLELQRTIVDASARRFQAHRTYLLAAAAIRWVYARTQLLGGQQPNASHTQALRRIDQTLQQERAGITDQHVFNALRALDLGHGYWVNEDPTLEQTLAWIRTQR